MRIPVWAVLVVLLTGCGSITPAPEDRFFRIVVEPAAPATANIIDGSISVARFRTDGLHGDRAIAWSVGDQEHLLKQYHNNFWVESPRDLVQSTLVSWLRDARVAELVYPRRGVEGELAISGTIRKFERVEVDAGFLASVSIEMEVRRDGATRPILARDYSARVPARSAKMGDTAIAFGDALGRIYGALLADIQESLQGSGHL